MFGIWNRKPVSILMNKQNAIEGKSEEERGETFLSREENVPCYNWEICKIKEYIQLKNKTSFILC